MGGDFLFFPSIFYSLIRCVVFYLFKRTYLSEFLFAAAVFYFFHVLSVFSSCFVFVAFLVFLPLFFCCCKIVLLIAQEDLINSSVT